MSLHRHLHVWFNPSRRATPRHKHKQRWPLEVCEERTSRTLVHCGVFAKFYKINFVAFAKKTNWSATRRRNLDFLANFLLLFSAISQNYDLICCFRIRPTVESDTDAGWWFETLKGPRAEPEPLNHQLSPSAYSRALPTTRFVFFFSQWFGEDCRTRPVDLRKTSSSFVEQSRIFKLRHQQRIIALILTSRLTLSFFCWRFPPS